MKAAEMFASVARILGDEDMEQYEEDELLFDLNDGLRAIGAVRPDAFANFKTWQIAPGNPQTLPAGAIRIREEVGLANMGVDGVTPGAQALIVKKKEKDLFDLSWRAATAGTVMQEIIYEETTPAYFETYPPVHATTAVYMQGRLAIAPPEISASSDDIPVAATYIRARREWMLYLNLSADDEETANLVAAANHARMFFNLLPVKMKPYMISSPKVRQMVDRGG